MRNKGICRAVTWLALLVILGAPGLAFSSGIEAGSRDAPSRLELEEVVVTASPVGKTLDTIPQNVTVITSMDIENATAENIVDLLGREAGLNIRGVTGNEGRSGIDIRGMGDTWVSNVIVMVDGLRLNASDMSGPDYLSIPLGRVERIEIIRGSGGVRFGDGAVGGVINIVTKRPDQDGVSGSVKSGAASFSTYNGRLQTALKQNRFFIQAGGGYKDSAGYRENGGLRKKDAHGSLGFEFTDQVYAELALSLLESRLGYPGPVTQEEARSGETRRLTDSPDDFSETTDNRASGRLEFENPFGLTRFVVDYRDRDNAYIIGYSPLLTETEQTDTIVEDTWHFSFENEHSALLAGRENTLTMGLEFYDTGYMREDAKTERNKGDIRRVEGFVHDEIRLPGGVTVSGGVRYSRFKGGFRDDTYEDFYSDPVLPPPVLIPPQYLYSQWTTGNVVRKVWKNNAFEAGLVWEPASWGSFFASFSKSYRVPNVDELILADADLHPQTSLHYDAGARFKPGDVTEITLAVFDITTTDEIYYGEDPETNTFFNRNYDEKTRRLGFEAEFKSYPAERLYLWANYSYTRAKFEQRGTDVPLVPRHMVNAGIEARIFEELVFALNGSYSSERYDGNDQTNTQDENILESYEAFDAKLTWNRGKLRVHAGIRNLFDEYYATSGYSGTVYPMAGRSYFAGISWAF